MTADLQTASASILCQGGGGRRPARLLLQMAAAETCAEVRRERGASITLPLVRAERELCGPSLQRWRQ
ncbi:hypothetical protein FQA47_018649 [Oryzias melastigma]|uniref:Uncharacterized protein n=1 Tax=Oryzias melastigma TaxID=30732 RepID=A0A834F6G5_ORYME|nr:hypothetical protein FQA47_018649 [Oryzias melastigma]